MTAEQFANLKSTALLMAGLIESAILTGKPQNGRPQADIDITPEVKTEEGQRRIREGLEIIFTEANVIFDQILNDPILHAAGMIQSAMKYALVRQIRWSVLRDQTIVVSFKGIPATVFTQGSRDQVVPTLEEQEEAR